VAIIMVAHGCARVRMPPQGCLRLRKVAHTCGCLRLFMLAGPCARLRMSSPLCGESIGFVSEYSYGRAWLRKGAHDSERLLTVAEGCSYMWVFKTIHACRTLRKVAHELAWLRMNDEGCGWLFVWSRMVAQGCACLRKAAYGCGGLLIHVDF
jgi:hypothetical protein